jgi:hypothetical protein
MGPRAGLNDVEKRKIKIPQNTSLRIMGLHPRLEHEPTWIQSKNAGLSSH